jgi:hypothetical protein
VDVVGPIEGAMQPPAKGEGLLDMSRESIEALPSLALAKGYDRSRFNALRHGILSQHLVLPWENQDEFDALHEALVAEHKPDGLTERHLVEEVACILWRKRRLCLAEAAAYKTGAPWDQCSVVARALAHLGVGRPTDSATAAIRATPEETEAELRDLAEEEAMTERALAILRKGKADACTKALAALHEDTRASWLEGCEVDSHDDDQAEDDEQEKPDAADLQWYLEEEIVPWYAQRRCELENRHLIRAQAFGEALDPHRLDKLARYEVHLDRKLERILGMLLKLQDLRRTITPDAVA